MLIEVEENFQQPEDEANYHDCDDDSRQHGYFTSAFLAASSAAFAFW